VATWLLEDATKLSAFIVRSRSQTAMVTDERLALPDNPDQLARTLQDEKLQYFKGLLDEQLLKWYREGKMRNHYQVGDLVLRNINAQIKSKNTVQKKKA